MSLPSPTVGRPTNTNGNQKMAMQMQMQMDAPLIALAQKCNGDLRLLLHSFFSFLHRRTDFYCIRHPLDDNLKTGSAGGARSGGGIHNAKPMGFKDGDAEKLLIAAFRQFPLRRMPPMEEIVKRKKEEEESAKKKKTINEKKNDPLDKAHSKAKGGATSKADPANQKNIDDDGSTSGGEGESESNNESASPRKSTNNNSIRYTDEGKQIPVGNGGSSNPASNFKYRWTQTLNEITIAMTLPSPQTRAKELSVKIQPNSILIHHLQSKPPADSNENASANANSILLQGKFPALIDVEESTWSIESGGGVILLQLEKREKTWWEKALDEDEDVIDVDLVDKKHKISNYDEVTQGMIRKLLFDERQERLGLPSSDEILQESSSKSKSGMNSSRVEPGDGGNGNVKSGDNGTNANSNDAGNIITSAEELKKIPGVEFIDKHNFPK